MNGRRAVVAAVALGVLVVFLAGASLIKSDKDALALSGNVDIREVNLAFRVPGRLKNLTVDEGARVHAGDLLGELDDQPYRLALRDATANHAALLAHRALYRAGYRSEDVAQADAALSARVAAQRDADQAYGRLLKLANTGATTQRAIDDALAQRDQARAQVDAARQQLAELRHGFRREEIDEADANEQRAGVQVDQGKLQLADARLIAPADGTILTRAAEPGTMLTAASTVYTLSLDAPVWVRAYAAESELGRLAPGTAVKIFTDSRQTPYDGTVGFVSPTAEFTPKNVETADLRTALVYRLRIVVSNPDGALRQGMPVTIRLVHG